MTQDWIEGRVVGLKHWSDNLYSLHIDAPLASFVAGQYIKVGLQIGDERVGRPYSLVNAPDERPLEIYFNEVPEGPLTPRLSDLRVGDRVWISSKAGGVFTMDNVVSRRDLWMLATGTALGVYLSILKTPDPWERFERVILIQGARHGGELAYADTIAELKAHYGERFTFLSTLTREQRPGSLQGRITALLEEGRLEQAVGIEISPESSHLMLCGNSAMIKDVRALLEARGLHRHKRSQPGHYTTEQYH
jgi:ferredoxin--NADP+ reductase